MTDEDDKKERARKFLERGGLGIGNRAYRKKLIAKKFLGMPPEEITDLERFAMKFGGNHKTVQRLLDRGLIVEKKRLISS